MFVLLGENTKAVKLTSQILAKIPNVVKRTADLKLLATTTTTILDPNSPVSNSFSSSSSVSTLACCVRLVSFASFVYEVLSLRSQNLSRFLKFFVLKNVDI